MPMPNVDTWKARSLGAVAAVVVMTIAQGSLLAQTPAQPTAPAAQMPMPAGSTPPAPAGVVQATAAVSNAPPSDYVIGADDILTVKVWQDERMSGDVVVRPDGMVTLALVNDINAAGLTPEQFRTAVMTAASKFVQAPTVDVIVKQINSRRVFMTGEVAKPAAYPLSSRMTVMQAIAMAGGLTEYANKGKVTILRTEGGKTVLLRVNYGDILDGKNLNQNYELKVGDVVTVSD
jgi:polysaccharide export outer membrane protein